MRPFTSPLLLGLLGSLGLLASAPPAFAQSRPVRPPRPLAELLQGAAKEAYSSGGLLYRNGDFAGAELKYKQAYDSAKDPRLLFNMAACEKERHHYARMQELLVRYARESGDALSAEERARADAALTAIKDLVGTVTVRVNVAGAEVTVDDEPAGTTPLPAPLTVDLGTHRLGVRKEGFEPVTATLEIQGGNSLDEPITLVEKAALAAQVDPAATGASHGDLAPSHGRVLPWSFAVGGVAVAAGGAVAMVVAAGNASSARNNHDKSAYDSAGSLWTVGLVGAIAGGAAALGGGIFLLVPQRDTTSAGRGSVWVGLEGSNVKLGGTW